MQVLGEHRMMGEERWERKEGERGKGGKKEGRTSAGGPGERIYQ